VSDSNDKESKTEEPTDNKLRTAAEQGNIAFSREVAALGPLASLLIVFSLLADGRVLPVTQMLAAFIERPGEWHLKSGADAAQLLLAVFGLAGLAILPVLAVLAAAGLGSAVMQNQPRMIADRIQPKLSRVSLTAGWTRIFGSRGLVDFGKSVVKLCLLALVSYQYLKSAETGTLSAMFAEPAGLPQRLYSAGASLVVAFVSISIVFAALDWIWVRFNWHQDLRMTRQEIKDEHKQLEGDPIIKARLKSLARDRARRRMILAVPRATLVIANPTHYAVALRYVRSEGGAPLVLAKGKDLIALKIREVAESKGIPVFEDKPLARSLYDSVEVDKMIPAEFYRAIAKIFLFLTSRGKLGPFITAD
jgi:flagellar biosynthesis protein FlhB